MGLDMYLYKTTKGQYKAKKNYEKASSEHWAKWGDFISSLPRKDNGWELDRNKLTDEQKTKLAQSDKELEEAVTATNYNRDSTNEVHYWRKFNALHGFIVQNFANGVDECQEIPLSKDDVKEIIKALKESKDLAEKGETDQLPMPPVGGFFFGTTEVGDYYKECVNESIPVFEELLKDFTDNDVVYYVASW